MGDWKITEHGKSGGSFIGGNWSNVLSSLQATISPGSQARERVVVAQDCPDVVAYQWFYSTDNHGNYLR
jgi:hypothetical protein